MTGKDKLIEYLQLEPNYQLYKLIGVCPSHINLNENQHNKCGEGEDKCSECWKLALDEKF